MKKQKIFTVNIVEMKFQPEELRVEKGDKVIFTNKDMVVHDVTEEAGKAWSSGPLAVGASWSLEVAESANYYCSIHPVMKARIIAE